MTLIASEMIPEDMHRTQNEAKEEMLEWQALRAEVMEVMWGSINNEVIHNLAKQSVSYCSARVHHLCHTAL